MPGMGKLELAATVGLLGKKISRPEFVILVTDVVDIRSRNRFCGDHCAPLILFFVARHGTSPRMGMASSWEALINGILLAFSQDSP